MAFASKKLSDWQARISSLDLRPAGGRGALWTGLGASPALCIAMQRGRFTLEMTRDGQSLNNGRLSEELATDFGPRWNPEKKLVWTWASRQFVSQMRGDVEVFVRKGSLKITDGMSEQDLRTVEGKILFDELMDMEIAGQVAGNGDVQNVVITEFDEKLRPSDTYVMPVSKEWN
jgi:hypothetical protein